MRRAPLALVPAVAALLAAASADANPFTHHLDGLVVELAERALDPSLTKAQKGAVRKAQKALGKTSASLAADARAAASVLKSLAKVFPGDAEFAALGAEAVAGLREDVGAGRDALDAVADAFPASAAKTNADAAVARVDAALALADGAADAATRASKLAAAQAKIDAARRSVLGAAKNGNYLVAFVDGEPFVAKSVTVVDFGGLGVTFSGARIGRNGASVTLAVYDPLGATTFALGRPGGGYGGTGTWTRGTTGLGGATWRTLGDEGLDPAAGTLTITSYDAERKIAEGTFSFVGTSDDAGAVTVAAGFFRADW